MSLFQWGVAVDLRGVLWALRHSRIYQTHYCVHLCYPNEVIKLIESFNLEVWNNCPISIASSNRSFLDLLWGFFDLLAVKILSLLIFTNPHEISAEQSPYLRTALAHLYSPFWTQLPCSWRQTCQMWFYLMSPKLSHALHHHGCSMQLIVELEITLLLYLG